MVDDLGFAQHAEISQRSHVKFQHTCNPDLVTTFEQLDLSKHCMIPGNNLDLNPLQ
jgi:hypothetical protein